MPLLPLPGILRCLLGSITDSGCKRHTLLGGLFVWPFCFLAYPVKRMGMVGWVGWEEKEKDCSPFNFTTNFEGIHLA